MKKKNFIITLFCLLLITGLTAEAATLSGTDISLASSGSSGTIDLMLDDAPEGLAGYQLEISFDPAGIVEISSVNFPAAFSMNSASSLPASTVSIVAVDLMDQVTAGASSTTLATLGISAKAEGSAEMQISITELTNDSGGPITAAVSGSKVTVGTGAPTPTKTPTATPTETPTEAPSSEPTTEPRTIVPTVTPTPKPTPEPCYGQPLAAFTAMPMTGTPPLTVNFTDHSTGDPKQWRWDFGDGTLSTVQNPTHVYGGIGRYTVTLEVMSGNYSSVERKPEIIRVVGDYPTGPSGFVMVTSQPSGAEVNMGDRYLGTTPATLIVPAGSRSLTFEKEGYLNKTVPVTIRPNEIKLVPKVMLKASS